MIASPLVDSRARSRELVEAAWLALVPVGVALVLGLLLAPRVAAPDGVPLPLADMHAIAAETTHDHTLAEAARTQPLSGPVRALGSAIREFHVREARGADVSALSDARRAVDLALIEALGGGLAPLLSLRAVELDGFVTEVERFEATGTESDELHALAGGFVRSMESEGWREGNELTPGIPVLRVLFKQMWQHFLGLEGREGFTPTLDEQRLLFAFYLSHPHPTKGMREAIAAARRGARDESACEALVFAERSAIESWRLDRIGRLAEIDPTYPADYARGVSNYRRGEYAAAARALRTWLDKHPEGPLSLRARNYLRAADDANRGP
jgi:hypothetical protein